jgi:tRNA uridine 5-carboxymethylaminomethyl modification enzyme
LSDIVVRPTDVAPGGAAAPLARDATAYALLRRPELTYRDVAALPRVGSSAALASLTPEASEQWVGSLEIEAHYAGYVARQRDEIEQQRRHDATELPADLDYARVHGLSNEIREKLGRIRPHDIGQAARISGMTPAAISLLLVHLKKSRRAPTDARASG